MDELTRCYQVLELKPGASEQEVKQAYGDLVRIWRPERFSRDPRLQVRAQEKFKEINGAYQTLLAHLFDPKPEPGPVTDSAAPPRPEQSAPVPETAPPETPPPAPAAVSSRKPALWAGLGLGLVLLVTGMVVYGLHRRAPKAPAPTPQVGPAWEVLFDGQSVEHWRGYKRESFPEDSWVVQDGALMATVGRRKVDLVTREQYADFELELEWRIAPGGNSGIMFHVTEDGAQPSDTGPEMQLLDDARHRDGRRPETSAGSLYGLIAPTNKVLQPVGQWNRTRILVRQQHVEYWLNDRKVVDYELGSDAFKALVAGGKFQSKPRYASASTGHIDLQTHTGEVWFRNIRIRRL